MDYQSDIEIDINELQSEWLSQPNLYMKYAELLTEAQESERDAKENIEIINAKVDLEIRKSVPEEHGLSKFTDKAIQALINSHEKVKDAKRDYNKKRKQAALLQSVINAIEQRKKALEFVSRFQLAGWDCYPNLREMDKEIFDKKAKNKLNKRKGIQ